MVETKLPKGRGRPRVARKPGERSTLSLRISTDIFERLDQEAKAHGRPLSNEAELRLKASLDREDALISALSLAFGEKLAALLLLIGDHVSGASSAGNFVTGSRHDHLTAWLNDAGVFDAAAKTAEIVFESIRPSPESDIFSQGWFVRNSPDVGKPSEALAESVVKELYAISHPSDQNEHDGRTAMYRRLLGPEMLRRIAVTSEAMKRSIEERRINWLQEEDRPE